LEIKSYNTIPTIPEGKSGKSRDSADIDIPWKKITRGLPKGRQAANDRAPQQKKFADY
jgi:hypothetical protein